MISWWYFCLMIFENLNGTGYTIFFDEFSLLFLPELQPRPRWRLRQVITWRLITPGNANIQKKTMSSIRTLKLSQKNPWICINYIDHFWPVLNLIFLIKSKEPFSMHILNTGEEVLRAHRRSNRHNLSESTLIHQKKSLPTNLHLGREKQCKPPSLVFAPKRLPRYHVYSPRQISRCFHSPTPNGARGLHHHFHHQSQYPRHHVECQGGKILR